MITTSSHDDVRAVRLSWWRSRLIGYAVHVYVVRGVLIDSGFPGAWRDIAALHDTRALRGAMLTHQHEDHAGNADLLSDLGVPLAASAATLDAIRAQKPIGFYRHFAWRAMRRRTTPFMPASAFSDPSLELVPTPGHSPDHHVVWDHETDTLFAGDLFLGVKVRIAHPYEDPRQQVDSLRAMIARNPRRMFCAHRGAVSNPVDLLTAKADWMDALVADIERLHSAGASIAEIRSRTLGARGWTHWISVGDYSPDNIVKAVIATGPSPRGPHVHRSPPAPLPPDRPS